MRVLGPIAIVDAALASPVANSPRPEPCRCDDGERPPQLGGPGSPARARSAGIEPEVKWDEPADQEPSAIEALGAPLTRSADRS